MLPQFDENAVIRRVQRLPWNLALAFGASCAGRLVSNYQKFHEETKWGDVQPILRALDFLCRIAASQTAVTKAEARAVASECEAQAPASEDFSSLFTSGAQDAVFAVCSLLDYCAERKAQQVALAARYPTDSVDLYVQEVENLSPQDPALEAKILAHPLMQQELLRQERDLVAVETQGASAVPELMARRTTEQAFQIGSSQ